MIHVIASITIKAGRKDEFLGIFKANVANVVKEKGCIEYRPAVDAATGLAAQIVDDNMVTVIEKWHSVEDLKVHLTAPHMLAYREKVAAMVESVALKVLQDA
ncbi:MAG: antibiotic biosynthesis monooxygenase [Desulfofustis sp.]|jgi:quinol monooxygenase YgiN|nr:antibiotic biosynthesis monooxygenase [Desulfofustis sp.]